jgi:hypothetical protein
LALIALFVALSGTAYAASKVGPEDIKKNAVRSKHVKNRSLLPKDSKRGALTAFAYVSDGPEADDDTAVVGYGRGVSAVSDPAGNSDYLVTFASSVRNCVVQATAGEGDPKGNGEIVESFPSGIVMSAGTSSEVSVRFRTAINIQADTSFLISAFC